MKLKCNEKISNIPNVLYKYTTRRLADLMIDGSFCINQIVGFRGTKEQGQLVDATETAMICPVGVGKYRISEALQTDPVFCMPLSTAKPEDVKERFETEYNRKIRRDEFIKKDIQWCYDFMKIHKKEKQKIEKLHGKWKANEYLKIQNELAHKSDLKYVKYVCLEIRDVNEFIHAICRSLNDSAIVKNCYNISDNLDSGIEIRDIPFACYFGQMNYRVLLDPKYEGTILRYFIKNNFESDFTWQSEYRLVFVTKHTFKKIKFNSNEAGKYCKLIG